MRHTMILAVALALTACADLKQAEQPIAIACQVASVGSAAFDAYVAAKPGKVDASGLRWKAGVVATIKPICANPAAVTDQQQALDTVIKIGFALSDFINGVEKAGVP